MCRENVRAPAVSLGPGVEPHITPGVGPSEKRLFFLTGGPAATVVCPERDKPLPVMAGVVLVVVPTAVT